MPAGSFSTSQDRSETIRPLAPASIQKSNPPTPSGLEASIAIRFHPGLSRRAASKTRSASPGLCDPAPTRAPLISSTQSRSPKKRIGTFDGIPPAIRKSFHARK
ncbi:MAG: hypothetical protein ACM3SU_06590 [Acidobacteriota bacterium]